jgi:CRP-like cAMP-binding protein
VNALAIPSGTPRFQQATILGPGSCFGMQTDVDKSGQLREEMLLMTRGRRLWKKLQMSKRLGSIGNFAKNASRCARRETITVPDDASNPDNADGCTLIKISFADITRLLSDYHSSQAHRVAADIARVPFFENWSKALLYKLSLVLENKNFAKEETIYEQSDDADSIMFLVDGKVDLYKDVKIVSFHRWPVSRAQWQITKTEQIRSFRVKSISDPSYFGEEALFNAQTRDFSACALTAVRVYRCPRSAFMRIYQEFSLRHFRNKVTSARFRAIRHIQTQYLQEVGKDIQNGRLKRGAHVLRCNMTLKELAPNNDIYDTVLNDLPVVHVPGVLPYTALGAPTSVTNGISETHAVLVGDDGVMYEEPQDAIVQHVGVPGTSTYMRRTLTVHNTNLAGRGSGSVIEMHYHPLMGNILGYRR